MNCSQNHNGTKYNVYIDEVKCNFCLEIPSYLFTQEKILTYGIIHIPSYTFESSKANTLVIKKIYSFPIAISLILSQIKEMAETVIPYSST